MLCGFNFFFISHNLFLSKMYFANSVARSIRMHLRNGPYYTIIEEHPAMEFADFVSNIGGILGVYLGISITGVIQLVLNCLEICHSKKNKVDDDDEVQKQIDQLRDKIEKIQPESKSTENIPKGARMEKAIA